MAARATLFFAILFISSLSFSSALYEDQVGLFDWHQKYLGKVKQAVFHTQKAGRKRVVVSTEENVIASIDLRTGDIFWRHVFGKNDVIDQIDITIGKYVITHSSQGSILRAWNLPDGQMMWESILHYRSPSKPLLLIPASCKVEKESLILVYSGGVLHAISSIDGESVWQKDFASAGLDVQQIYQETFETSLVNIVGYASGSSAFSAYQINAKTGDVLKQDSASFPSGFFGEMVQVSSNMLVALDSTRSSLVSISFQEGVLGVHQTYISDFIEGFNGRATLLPQNLPEMFIIETDSLLVLVKAKGKGEIEMVENLKLPASISEVISLAEGQQAFAILQHAETGVHLRVRFVSDAKKDILGENIRVDSQKGHVEKIFINNYVRTDRSHGFRALLVMEDHSLMLVQQGDVVWSREDGLASIVGSTTSELPVKKDGVSVAKVEENLLEWLKGHLLKLKGTLMLASADDIAAIQELRLRSSGKNKMTRDRNGFRKLIVVLTKAGKVLALHTGDGRVIWSLLLPSLRRSAACQNPSPLSIYQWSVPHHHAMQDNPSVLVVGRCGLDSDEWGVLSVVDSYTGKELSSIKTGHSISQVIPLPFMDPTEKRLHLIIDADSHAHLYPRTSNSVNVFLREMPNTFFYSLDAEKDMIRGYSLRGKCGADLSDDYCFKARELWTIAFPSYSEKIAVTTTRKMNEVVHTQAKVTADQDVMYKYISRNILFVATVSPKGAGEIGSVTPEEAWLVAYLIDTVTGRILHRVTHQGAQGPIHAVMSENWVVYHYFNLRAHRYEMAIVEIYDQSRADNKDVLKLVLGKHNLTTPISSYSRPEVVVKSQSYFFTHSVKALEVTSTAKGITSKQLLVGTIGDQILALDKRYLDPRRTANPSQSEREEGIIPLTDSLPINPQSYITHSLQVEGLRGVVTFPSKLESTTLIFTYGVDLFYTRLAPSRTYDSLTEDFSYALLLITIVALVVAIVVTWAWSEKKELQEKWR